MAVMCLNNKETTFQVRTRAGDKAAFAVEMDGGWA